MSATGLERLEGRLGSLLVCEDAEDLARQGTAVFLSRARRAIEKRGRLDVLLAGGETPRRLYRLLAGEASRAGFSWRPVHLFWGDERMVPEDSPESNFRMARETLLSGIDIPASNIHRVPTELGDASEVARRYERELREYFGNVPGFPSFDLVLLGLGLDGHTASLFPDSGPAPSPGIRDGGWVIAPYVEKLGAFRITVTLGVLNAARTVIFLVSGRDKGVILKQVLSSGEPDASLPARKVLPREGERIWLVDREAASRLRTG